MVELAFGTPRKLPKPDSLSGKVGVLDIAFAGVGGKSGSFESVTLPFIQGLASRLRIWVDHHDHDEHGRYASDRRFVLATKAEHGACPEMIDPALVERVGKLDTIVCHTDFDDLASAAKWLRGGLEPYPGADADARAIDTRLGTPGPIADRMDRALRGRPNDHALMGVIVRHLASGLEDASLWEPIDRAGAELLPIERETRITLRTDRARVATDRPASAIETTKSDSLSFSDGTRAWPFRVARPPWNAANVSFRVGSWTTPTTGRPASTRAIETQKNGMPLA
jgi:hypothetical protein